MQEKLIKYIKRKLFKKYEVLDDFDVPTDDEVKFLMITTFEIVENECQQCFFCKNYKRFSLGSLCKIKSHIQKDCFHFTLDINKVLKKKYYKILITLDESTYGRRIMDYKNLSAKAQKNVIYESIRLYEMIRCYNEILEVEV